jgi:hypothetical protein
LLKEFNLLFPLINPINKTNFIISLILIYWWRYFGGDPHKKGM